MKINLTYENNNHGNFEYEGKVLHLLEEAEVGNSKYPVHDENAFSAVAKAKDDDGNSYYVTWEFVDDGRELDSYDWNEVDSIEKAE